MPLSRFELWISFKNCTFTELWLIFVIINWIWNYLLSDYPPCCPVSPQGCPPLCCPPQSHALASLPSRSTGCLVGCPLDPCSPYPAGCYCSYCQQPRCPSQCSQPCCSSGPPGNIPCYRPTRVVCCCCPTGGSPPFNMTGPPPCCRTPPFESPGYGVSACYGTPACYGAQPCYGAVPCYGDMGNQFKSYPMPWSQSELNMASKVPEEFCRVPLPQDQPNKKEAQKQEAKS